MHTHTHTCNGETVYKSFSPHCSSQSLQNSYTIYYFMMNLWYTNKIKNGFIGSSQEKTKKQRLKQGSTQLGDLSGWGKEEGSVHSPSGVLPLCTGTGPWMVHCTIILACRTYLCVCIALWILVPHFMIETCSIKQKRTWDKRLVQPTPLF